MGQLAMTVYAQAIKSLTGILALLGKEFVNLFADLTLRNFDIVLSVTRVGHEGEKAIVGDIELLIVSGRCPRFSSSCEWGSLTS